MSDDFAALDATAQADLVRRREVAPIELVDAATASIERLNPRLNAVTIPLFEKARQQAVSPDLPDGPFRGVPLLLKDFLCHTAGDPYYEGTRFLRDIDWREPEDTYLAAKFRAAGFVFLGKTNLPELAYGGDGAFGRSNNPWDVERTPGGSSSGSAAAVASRMVPLAYANDGTGSIRLPASCCGLIGLKPSRGRASAGPGRTPYLLGNAIEFGLTQTVRDTAALLDVTSGNMPGDLFVAPPPTRAWSLEVGVNPGRLRIGVLVEDIFMNLPVHVECVAAVRRTAAVLESMGHQVEEACPPAWGGASGLGEALRIVSRSELASRIDYWSERIGRVLGPEDMDASVWERVEDGRSRTAVEVHWAVNRLAAGVMRAPEWWSGFDLLLTPTTLQPAPRWDDSTTLLHSAEVWGMFTWPASISGQPAISVPTHWTPEGVPIGVQLVADYAREDVLIRVASQLEEAMPWRDRVALVSA